MELIVVEHPGHAATKKSTDHANNRSIDPPMFSDLFNLTTLPTESTKNIYANLEPPDIGALSLVSKHLLDIFYTLAITGNAEVIKARHDFHVASLNGTLNLWRKYFTEQRGLPSAQMALGRRFSYPEARNDPFTTWNKDGLNYLESIGMIGPYITIIKNGLMTIDSIRECGVIIKATQPQFFADDDNLRIAVYFTALGVDISTISYRDYELYKMKWIQDNIFTKPDLARQFNQFNRNLKQDIPCKLIRELVDSKQISIEKIFTTVFFSSHLNQLRHPLALANLPKVIALQAITLNEILALDQLETQRLADALCIGNQDQIVMKFEGTDKKYNRQLMQLYIRFGFQQVNWLTLNQWAYKKFFYDPQALKEYFSNPYFWQRCESEWIQQEFDGGRISYEQLVTPPKETQNDPLLNTEVQDALTKHNLTIKHALSLNWETIINLIHEKTKVD